MLKKLYTKFIFIIVIFFSMACFAETGLEKKSSYNPVSLPTFFKEVTSPIASLNNGIFYNQVLEKRSLENFDNRFIIIHFWASWCMDCQSELINLNKLQKDFRKKALLVLAISEDFKEVSAIDEYFSKHKIDYLDIYIDKKNAIYNTLGINHLPVSYLVDFNGSIIASSLPGVPVDWEDENLIKFLEHKVSNQQLLPPEYKSTREPYIKLEEKEEPKKEKNKPQILIN